MRVALRRSISNERRENCRSSRLFEKAHITAKEQHTHTRPACISYVLNLLDLRNVNSSILFFVSVANLVFKPAHLYSAVTISTALCA